MPVNSHLLYPKIDHFVGNQHVPNRVTRPAMPRIIMHIAVPQPWREQDAMKARAVALVLYKDDKKLVRRLIRPKSLGKVNKTFHAQVQHLRHRDTCPMLNRNGKVYSVHRDVIHVKRPHRDIGDTSVNVGAPPYGRNI